MQNELKISVTKILIVLYFLCFLILDNGTIFSTVGKVFFAILVTANILLNYKSILNLYSAWLVIYSAFVLLSVTWAKYSAFAMQAALTVAYTTICSLSFPTVLAKRKSDLIFLYKMIIFSPLIYFTYYLIFYDVPNVFNLRDGAINQAYNNIGLYAAYSFLFIMIYQSTVRKSTFYSILYVVDLLLIIISQSRKSLIYIGIVIVLYLIFSSKNILKTFVRIIISFAILIIIYYLFKSGIFGNSMKELVLSFEGDVSDSSYVGRMNQFDISMGLFDQNRILGLGIGAIEFVCRFIHGQAAPIVDNDYLDILADLGILGIVLYYGFHTYLLGHYIRFKKLWNKGNLLFFILLVILFIQGFLIRGYFNNYYVPLLLYLIYYNGKDISKHPITAR